MKIFIDIGHPAHVHYFKYLISQLSNEGHSFVITARDKEMTHYLLNRYGISYYSRGKGREGILGKFFYMIKADYSLYKLARNENPDLFLSFSSPYAAQVSWLLGKDHVALDDTEHAKLQHLFYRPFTKKILTPSCYRKDLGSKQHRFSSYLELSYLHPNVFQPDLNILNLLGVKEGEKYSILRFVRWGAAHDRGHSGISYENKVRAVEEFKKHGKVFISSETSLPESLNKYRIQIPPEKIHDALAFASMFYGESATMASESAVLGTPAIYVNDLELGYIKELDELYGLVHSFTESERDQFKAIEKGVSILNSSSDKYRQSRENLLKKKIDLTNYLKEYLLNYN